MSAGYSLLDEAWGSQAAPVPRYHKSSSKRRRKQRLPPLCDDMRAPPGEPSYSGTFQADHLAPFQPVYVNDDDARDVEQADEPPPEPRPAAHKKERPERAERAECPPTQIIRYAEPPRTPVDDRYDTFLYVFSGVLLLFLLEQFLQIGIHIGAQQHLYGHRM